MHVLDQFLYQTVSQTEEGPQQNGSHSATHSATHSTALSISTTSLPTHIPERLLISKTKNSSVHYLNPLSKPKVPKCYRDKKVKLTEFWIPKENEWDQSNKGKRILLSENPTKPLKDVDKNTLAMVSPIMWNKCNMEGTCLLSNGNLMNLGAKASTFEVLGGKGRTERVFGCGSGDRSLVPFVSVASNDLPYGETLYIQELNGMDLGGGQKHNGCVRVDDSGWSFGSCQLDLFVVSYVDYLWLNLPENVLTQVKKCKVKNYTTVEHLAYVQADTSPSTLEAVPKGTC
ncbi:hypothetical protein BDF14DRAFT_1728949 [Spinellus fusiger]|nr:hypothetical protein BDF14DRAFT_1728949 [Spinellus fusiger]